MEPAKILEAATFGDVVDAVQGINTTYPLDVPSMEAQLGRVTTALFVRANPAQGEEFLAATAGRLMYEVAMGLLLVALNADTLTEQNTPMRWELIGKDDIAALYVVVLLSIIRGSGIMDEQELTDLGGKVFTQWGMTQQLDFVGVEAVFNSIKEK